MVRASTRLTMLTAPCHSGSLYAIVNNKSRRAIETAIGVPRQPPDRASASSNIVPGRRLRSPPPQKRGHRDRVPALVIRRFKPLFPVIIDPHHFLIGAAAGRQRRVARATLCLAGHQSPCPFAGPAHDFVAHTDRAKEHQMLQREMNPKAAARCLRRQPSRAQLKAPSSEFRTRNSARRCAATNGVVQRFRAPYHRFRPTRISVQHQGSDTMDPGGG
jgi:hypothetical protein